MTADLVKRAAFTVAMPATILLLGRVSLPGMRADALLAFGGTEQLSVMALGLGPALSAFMLVEIVALLVPPWRRLRHGGLAERARLTRISLRLAVVLALLQGFMIAVGVSRMMSPVGPLVADPGFRFLLFTTLTLTAGSLLVIWIAYLISRYGLANGFAAIVSLSFLYGIVVAFAGLWDLLELGAVSPFTVLLLLVLYLAIVVLTLVVLLAPRESIRLPASGMVPVTLATSLLMLVATILGLAGVSRGISSLVYPGGWLYQTFLFVFVLVSAPLFVRLFNPPLRIAALHRKAVPLLRPIVQTTAFLLVLLIIMAFGQWVGFIVPAVALVLVVATACDVIEEWKMRAAHPDLVAVWPLHALYAIEPVIESLRAAGIPAHSRSARFRTLTQFFAPYVPVQILVPRASEAEAERIVREVMAR